MLRYLRVFVVGYQVIVLVVVHGGAAMIPFNLVEEEEPAWHR